MDDDIEIEIEESGQEFAAAPGMNCFLKFLKLQISTLVWNKKKSTAFLFDKTLKITWPSNLNIYDYLKL